MPTAIYPLVMTNIAIENPPMFHGKTHYQWPFSIAMLVITRGYHPIVIPYHPIHGQDMDWTSHLWGSRTRGDFFGELVVQEAHQDAGLPHRGIPQEHQLEAFPWHPRRCIAIRHGEVTVEAATACSPKIFQLEILSQAWTLWAGCRVARSHDFLRFMCLSVDVSLSESRDIQSMANGKRIRCKASGLDESNVVTSSRYVCIASSVNPQPKYSTILITIQSIPVSRTVYYIFLMVGICKFPILTHIYDAFLFGRYVCHLAPIMSSQDRTEMQTSPLSSLWCMAARSSWKSGHGT